jgi:pimeloyl-ACP methyl ester carboxylesterase
MKELLSLLGLTVLASVQTLAQTAAPRNDNSSHASSQASLESIQIPSHGVALNAFEYKASGSGVHPILVLLHGFPGHERNLDIAQSVRRAGWNVIYFDYRGSWGSPGTFSFTHCIEDAGAVVSYMRERDNAERLHVDPLNIVLLGHSVGGLLALEAAAGDPRIKAVITVSAVDFNGFLHQFPRGSSHEALVKGIAQQFVAQGMEPISGTTPESLAAEVLQHANAWSFLGVAPKVKSQLQLVVTSDDGLAQMSDALVSEVQKESSTKVSTLKLATDHNYSDQRLALQEAVLKTLTAMGKR